MAKYERDASGEIYQDALTENESKPRPRDATTPSTSKHTTPTSTLRKATTPWRKIGSA